MGYYVEPGWRLSLEYDDIHQYHGFVQVPIYSDFVGYQLFPRYTFSAGASDAL